MKKILIPAHIFNSYYDGSRHPQGDKRGGIGKGANCQYFAYSFLRNFGFEVGNLRSSDLWKDKIYTKKITSVKPLDILLFNNKFDPYGAHVGVCVGKNRILHLCKEVGYPTIWDFEAFSKHKKYKAYIGAKRPKKHITKKHETN